MYTTIETEEMYDDMLDEVIGDIAIGSLTYSASVALKRVDPIAYRIGLSEYVDSLDEEQDDEPEETNTLVPARFGRTGKKVHLATADLTERNGRTVAHLTASVPVCGTYTRPGSGVALVGAEVTCVRCGDYQRTA